MSYVTMPAEAAKTLALEAKVNLLLTGGDPAVMGNCDQIVRIVDACPPGATISLDLALADILVLGVLAG